jgi:mannose-1-phosphate guanylyltransferase
MPANNYALIMAGGRGTRFWPRSRRRSAKQVLQLFGEHSLIQQTVDRLAPLVPPERVWVITNDFLRETIVRQLPQVPRKQILAEPAQRNTAPCIGLAAHILQTIDSNSVLGVFPADQLVTKPAQYRSLLRSAYRAASEDHIVVVGIQPRWPETGFGYIEFPKGVVAGSNRLFPVLSFKEKPEIRVARRYVQEGRYFWNSGQFFWRTDVFLDVLRRYLPKTATMLASLPAPTSRGFGDALSAAFPHCDDISVDYAIIEKLDSVLGIAAGDMGWNDVGSWNAIYELSDRDRSGNAVLNGDFFSESSEGNLVDASGKLVALLGIKDLVIVDTPDALLIAHRGRAQDVGRVVEALEKSGRKDLT